MFAWRKIYNKPTVKECVWMQVNGKIESGRWKVEHNAFRAVHKYTSKNSLGMLSTVWIYSWIYAKLIL